MGKTVTDCAQMFHILGDATRLKLVQALVKDGQCVDELAKAIQSRPARVSHHLAILRAGRIVQATREGKRVRYELTKPFHQCVRWVAGSTELQFPCLGKIVVK